VIVAVVLVLVLSGGGGGSPQDAAEGFIAAAEAHDCDKAYDLLSADLKEQWGTCEDNADTIVPAEGQEIAFGDVTVSGESDSAATAKVDATSGEQTVTLTLSLVKENGEWKVDQLS
jgi:hypothetical protein